MSRRAWIIGTGLIGGSIGLALRQRGWLVSGTDMNAEEAERALDKGALDSIGPDPEAEVVFVAVPASSVVSVAAEALRTAPQAVVSDVAGVKSRIVTGVAALEPGSDAARRFVGGHPMAGSEKDGVAGADGSLFQGRAWVLTPTGSTDPEAFARLHGVVTSLGARVIATSPERHDSLVALVSHVPHLLAATLMGLAGEEAEDSAELLPLAAGGFRDMTRVAAGSPDFWPDICAENSPAIVSVLTELSHRLDALARLVGGGDREALLDLLRRARAARSSLPALPTPPETVTEIRVPVQDRPGALAEVTTLASQLSVNIADVEIAHSPEGGGGVLVMLVDGRDAARFSDSLAARGYPCQVRGL